jgi:hypothetical protein
MVLTEGLVEIKRQLYWQLRSNTGAKSAAAVNKEWELT